MYPSGTRKKILEGVAADIVKYVTLDSYNKAFKAMMTCKTSPTMAKEYVLNEMEKEFVNLTGGATSSSILKNSSPDGLLAFTLETLVNELEKRA